jgi:hypothetical protein
MYFWFIRIIFLAVAQFVRGDSNLRKRDDCDLLLKIILKKLARIVTPSDCIPIFSICTYTTSDGTTIIRNFMKGDPYNYIQMPTKCGIIKDTRDSDVFFICSYISHVYDIVFNINIGILIGWISWIIRQKLLGLGDISFALRTLWFPAVNNARIYEGFGRCDRHNGCGDINTFPFKYTFNEYLLKWFHGEYPQDFVPTGCDPLRILHDRFPE